MSIYKLNFNEYTQDLKVNIKNKLNYGEIHTDFKVIEKMFNLIPEKHFLNLNLRWLDPGCGFGYFSMILFKKLNETLKKALPDSEIRKKHIIENMIFMIEINEEYKNYLRDMFGDSANIISNDFLTYESKKKFDIVLGNPPFNFQGMKKVPTNLKLKKKKDGKTIWGDFIKKAVSLLNLNGLLLFIVPSIWMKPDRFKLYDYITQYKLHYIHCFSNTEMNKLFRGEAQTPSCFFLLQKKSTDKKVLLYDKCYQKYSLFNFNPGLPIPVFGVSIINKLLPYVEKYGNLNVIKTNMPSKKIKFNLSKNDEYSHANIKTCILTNNKPSLSINYSDSQCPYANQKKIVLAHGMYGFPFVDFDGTYGISNRDKYVYLNDSYEQLNKVKAFLSSKFALYIFETTRYRMKYLEKYCFKFIPNILNIPDFPDDINDKSIAKYFNFSNQDIEHIENLHKKNYLFF